MNGKGKFSKLYDSVEKIPVKIFFQILKDQNLDLLNPEKVRVKQERLREIWCRINEEYFKRSNPTKYNADLKKLFSFEEIRNELIGCSAALQLYKLNSENKVAIDGLTAFGFNVERDGIKKITSRLLTRKTKLTMRINAYEKKQRRNESLEEINFWKLVENVELSRGQPLPDINTMKLDRWIEIFKSVKAENVKKRQAIKSRR